MPKAFEINIRTPVPLAMRSRLDAAALRESLDSDVKRGKTGVNKGETAIPCGSATSPDVGSPIWQALISGTLAKIDAKAVCGSSDFHPLV